MKKLPFILCAILLSHAAMAQHSKVVKDYIETYKDIAIDEMVRTGVPASITLAQGIHESNSGQSNLVKRSNNHFGIKCKSEWKGEWVSHDDDAKGECFRKYDDPFESYRDHSDFLKTRAHYSSLFKLDPRDYEGWAYGLKKAGYATNPKYPQVLIKLVKDYNLQEYTMIALERNSNEPRVMLAANKTVNVNETSEPAQPVLVQPTQKIKQYPSGIFRINDTKVTMISQGTSYLKVAEENGLSLTRLFDFNDMKPADIALTDHLLYLQRKRKIGDAEFHTVLQGEDLHAIAQEHGMRLENLREFNRLSPGMEPAAGTRLYLKASAPSANTMFDGGDATRGFARSQAAPSNGQPEYHTVQTKETLYSISKKYDVTVEELMRWNDMSTHELKQGQQLKIYKRTMNAVN
jgi:LysM repeat protein